MNKFNRPDNEAVFTTTYVLRDRMPILRVSHDDDGELQFHCGNGDNSLKNAMLVCLSEIIRFDSTVEEVADLPRGFAAERTNIGGPWIYSQD